MGDTTAAAVGARVNELRRQAGITQATLAETLNVSIDSLSRMEKGVRAFDVNELVAAAELLQVSPLDLLPLKTFDPFSVAAVPGYTLDLKQHRRIVGALVKLAIEAGADPAAVVAAMEPDLSAYYQDED